ncbi:MAG: hypothetical protein QOD77_623 [Thermoplasmata archaeon]|jgi:hypothetical protein|nr:hypothetical protein [Thermoplasmata archaeon]
MTQNVEGRGAAVKKPAKNDWGKGDAEEHGLKEWGQGRPLFGAGGMKPAEGKLAEHYEKGEGSVFRGAEDLKAKTGMGREHVQRNKGDDSLEAEKEGGVARMDTEKEGIGGDPGKRSDGKVRRKGADA